MPPPNRKLEVVLDYIMNQASPAELQAVQQALERRQGAAAPGAALPRDPGQMDFKSMAKRMTGEMATRFAQPGGSQINQMTRNIVRNMILQNEPNITEEHLEILLNKMAPDLQQIEQGREGELPNDVLEAMVEQFVAFSQGRMPEKQDRELRAKMPEWPKNYWEFFSVTVRTLIKETLEGVVDHATYRRLLSDYIASRGPRSR